jgi:hypothetical protein
MPENDPDHIDLSSLRGALSTERSALRAATFEAKAAEERLRTAIRLHGAHSQEATTARDESSNAKKLVSSALASSQKAGLALSQALGRLALKPGEEVSMLSPDPIVLLPLRIETRFGKDDAGVNVLRVRIYPDEICAELHELELTEGEKAAAQAFWEAGWDPTNEMTAWKQLVRATSSVTRAA